MGNLITANQISEKIVDILFLLLFERTCYLLHEVGSRGFAVTDFLHAAYLGHRRKAKAFLISPSSASG